MIAEIIAIFFVCLLLYGWVWAGQNKRFYVLREKEDGTHVLKGPCSKIQAESYVAGYLGHGLSAFSVSRMDAERMIACGVKRERWWR